MPRGYPFEILKGDCLNTLRTLSDECFQLVVTSPPYANQRKKLYGGVHPDKYVEWFLPISAELKRVLKPTGTFILNIKENVVDGERHTYVLDLIKALQAQGWLWTEEFVWHKKNSTPGKWPNRFRDGWERVLQFNRQRKFDMYQDEVMVPVGDWADSRMDHLSEKDKSRQASAVSSGFGRNVSNWKGRQKAYPDNVLHMATECSNEGHGAVFPVELPTWFIKLFSRPDDLILDPFSGSGTTGIAATQLGRKYLGIEVSPKYVNLSLLRLSGVDPKSIDPSDDAAVNAAVRAKLESDPVFDLCEPQDWLTTNAS
jgi:DNA modification methylase